MRILVMAGGTGGHIFPALAVALHLREQGHGVSWLGVSGSMEQAVAVKNQISFYCADTAGVRGKGWWHKIKTLSGLVIALWQALRAIKAVNPDVVLGMGGYVTGPGGIAAWLLRKRLVIHEQNAVAGMTNRILARFSTKVLEAFPSSFGTKINAVVTGNPVRASLQALRVGGNKDFSMQRPAQILILGGSNGARALNTIIPELLVNGDLAREVVVWHQTGKNNLAQVLEIYDNLGIDLQRHRVVGFIEDMAVAYGWADIVICRAGALTVAELAMAGAASILIPYPYAVDDHQTKNAQLLVNAGAGVILDERELSVANLQILLREILLDNTRLQAMSRAAYALAQPNAVELVAAQCH